MRKIPFGFKFIAACVMGFLLQLTLHEMGQAMFAIATGNKVMDIHVGIVSYAEIMVVNEWSTWVISIGSFVFPIIVCLFLEIFTGQFVKSLSAIILAITTIQLAINAIALLCVQDISELQTYDLGICITSVGMNNILLSVAALISVIALTVWTLHKLKKIVDSI